MRTGAHATRYAHPTAAIRGGGPTPRPPARGDLRGAGRAAQAERATVAKQENAARAEAAKQARAATLRKLEALGLDANDIKLALGLA